MAEILKLQSKWHLATDPYNGGGMAEWFKATVLKTVRAVRSS